MKIDYMVDEILNLFDNDDFNKIEDLNRKLPSLCDNNLACCIEDRCANLYYSYPSLYKYASYYFIKHDKRFKEYIRPLDIFEFGGKKNSDSAEDKILIDMARNSLLPGNYIIKNKNSNYTYLSITINNSNDGDSNLITKVYFIGKKYLKYRNEFMKKWNKMKDLVYNNNTSYIQSIGKRTVETIFKSFDEFIYKDKDDIMLYIDNWFSSIPKYSKFGMIPKLSILLYGEPGTGKSTFAKALAKYFDIDNVTLITQENFINEGSKSNVSHFRGTVFLIDDIDCICSSREDTEDNKNLNSRILSNLLSFLDNPPSFNITAKDGLQYLCSIVVATTNYYDKLDPAIKRYGRFDKKIHMESFDKYEAQSMCDIYNIKLEDLADRYKDVRDLLNSKDGKISPSYLQSICLENIDNILKGN